MASANSKYPFFQNLRTVAATVNDDVKEIGRKMQNSKFEMPENNAMFKLIQLCDDMNIYKSDSQAFLEKLYGENKKYGCYRKDIELLADEMERSIDRVEELLIGYGYQKWHPEHKFMDSCDQPSSNTSNETPPKETLGAVSLATEEMQQSALQKTPVLADYGLTSKIPKCLPSALKDKQESVLKSSKKQVHFESPQSMSVKGKENRVPYSLQKTPLLEDYGLPSRKRNLLVPDMKDALHIKKQLNFRSPLGSVSKNSTCGADLLPVADIDDTDDFRELVGSLNTGEKVQVGVPNVHNDMKLSTPEEPFLTCSQRIRFASKRQNETVTPEEPEIEPIRILGTSKIMGDNGGTPEDPIAVPVMHPYKGGNGETSEDPIAMSVVHLYKGSEPSTPKTPEFEVTSSLKKWLQAQNKR